MQIKNNNPIVYKVLLVLHYVKNLHSTPKVTPKFLAFLKVWNKGLLAKKEAALERRVLEKKAHRGSCGAIAKETGVAGPQRSKCSSGGRRNMDVESQISPLLPAQKKFVPMLLLFTSGVCVCVCCTCCIDSV